MPILAVSLASIFISFFRIGSPPFDAAWLAIVLCGFPIIRGAIIGLFTRLDIKADVLVSIALVASVIIGEIFAAAEVAFIMAVGAYLEERTVARARAGIEKLLRLSPATARVLENGVERIILADEVKAGDALRVLAGETIAVDGLIISGQSSIDQSVMTGESMPVDKGPGDEVMSGTVNQFGTFEMLAQKVGMDSSIKRMIRLLESADAGKTKIVALTDKWAAWIVAIALSSALVTALVTGEVIRAVTILLVFCPCALVLATPTAIMAGIGNAARYGILIGRGDALERLSGVSRVAFDKTGTLTFGRPSVIKVESCRDSISESDLLKIAAGAECRSEHPLGRAISEHWRREYGENPPQPENFTLIAGRGVSALVEGRSIHAGNEAFMAEKKCVLPPRFQPEIDGAKENGSTIIFVMDEQELLGFIILSDMLRPDAAFTVKAIEGTGAKTLLLTGDSPQAARHMAALAKIADVRAGCLPQDKLLAIREYQERGEPVCMVGDGINDAPALKAAHVGIAMGGIGSDIAIEAADIVLARDDIREIPHLLSLSRRVMRTISINISAAMILNFIAIALAAAGLLDPVAGALVHNLGSVAVVLNSTFLQRYRHEPAA